MCDCRYFACRSSATRLFTLESRFCRLIFSLLAIDVINKEEEYETRDRDEELEETIARDKKKSKEDKKEDWEIEEKVEAIREDKNVVAKECIWLA